MTREEMALNEAWERLDKQRFNVERLVVAAKVRLEKGHNDTCSKVVIGGDESYMCDCGHTELEAALKPFEK